MDPKLEKFIRVHCQNHYKIAAHTAKISGRPFGQVKSKVKKDFANIQLTSWKVRPIVSWINYEYVPLQHRVLFASSVASCWAVFLNLKAARSSALPAASKNA